MITDLTVAEVRNFTDGALVYARGSLDKQAHDADERIAHETRIRDVIERDRAKVLAELKRRGL